MEVPTTSTEARGAGDGLHFEGDESAFSGLPFRERLDDFLSDPLVRPFLEETPDAVLPFLVRPEDLTDEVRGIVNDAVHRMFPDGGSVELRSFDVPTSGDHSHRPFAPLTAAGSLGFAHRVRQEMLEFRATRSSHDYYSKPEKATVSLRDGDWFRSLPEDPAEPGVPFSFLEYLRRCPPHDVRFEGGYPSEESIPAPANEDVRHLRDYLSDFSPSSLPDNHLLDAAFLGRNFELVPVDDFSTIKSHQQLVVIVDKDAVNYLVGQSLLPTKNPFKRLRRLFKFDARTLRPPRLEDLSHDRALPLGVLEGQDSLSKSKKPRIILTQTMWRVDEESAPLRAADAGDIRVRDLSLHKPSSDEGDESGGAQLLRYIYMDRHVAWDASSSGRSGHPSYTYEIKPPQFRVYRVEYKLESPPGVVGR